MSATEVKICGLKEPSHAEAASAAGAAYVGVVFAERLRLVTPEAAAAVVGAIHGGTRAVGVFVDATLSLILRNRDVARFHIAQLHGSESPSDCEALRAEGLGVWKALRPPRREALGEDWTRFADVADAILVEGFAAEAAGGTGSAFPYEWLTDLDRNGPSLVLAGGLDARGVSTAIEAARPDVVDVSSGVESRPGVKSISLIDGFLRAVKGPEVLTPACAAGTDEAGEKP